MEICINNQWGTVCDDYWGTADATVVCRQLGYSAQGLWQNFIEGYKIFIHTCVFMLPDGVAFRNAHFGAGVGAIFLNYVHCKGSEKNLLGCSRSWAVNCYRGHREDAGVRCQGRL